MHAQPILQISIMGLYCTLVDKLAHSPQTLPSIYGTLVCLFLAKVSCSHYSGPRLLFLCPSGSHWGCNQGQGHAKIYPRDMFASKMLSNQEEDCLASKVSCPDSAKTKAHQSQPTKQ